MAHPFLVIYPDHSGLPALFDRIAAHPRITMRGEVFGNKVLPGQVAQTDDNRLAFIEQFWRPFEGGARPDGAPFKGFLLRVTRKGHQFSDPERLGAALQGHRPQVVVLRRDNILRQALAEMMVRHLASQSGGRRALALAGDAALAVRLRDDRLVVDLEDLTATLGRIRGAYAKLDTIIAPLGPVCEIGYEECLDAPDELLGIVMRHLGLDPSLLPAAADTPDPEAPLDEIVANADAVRHFAEADSQLAGMA